MFKLEIVAINKGEWQLFITNQSSPADYIRIAIGAAVYFGSHIVNDVTSQLILTPPKNDEGRVLITALEENQLKYRRPWVAFDAVVRANKDHKKPKVIGKYFADCGSVSEFPLSIGNPKLVPVKQRESDDELAEFIQEYRFNFKEEYLWQIGRYTAKRDQASSEDNLLEILGKDHIAPENRQFLVAIEQLLAQYNAGVQLDEVEDLNMRAYYKWFMQDFDLDKPSTELDSPALTMADIL